MSAQHLQNLTASSRLEEELERNILKDMREEGQFEPVRSETPLNIVVRLKACATQKDLSKGCKLHAYVRECRLLEKNACVGSSVVNMYAKCGALAKAKAALEELSVRNVFTWSALIAGYAKQGQGEEALRCYDSMQHEGHTPSAVTFTCALKACGSIGAAAKGEEIYVRITSLGMLEKDIILGNSLVDMYVKCGELAKAKQLLEVLPARDVVTWSAVMAGYVQESQGEEALKCYDSMLREGHSPDGVTFTYALKACGSIRAAFKGKEIHDKIISFGMLEKDIVLGNTLVDMYVRCAALAKAQQVLEELSLRDVVTWTALIAGYAQQGQGEEALKCYDNMLREGHSPNAVTFICALNACGSIEAIAKGEEIHGKIVKLGILEKDIALMGALIDMYAKCGALGKAHRVLEEVCVQNVVTWSALIAGYVQQGKAEEALECFDSMLCKEHFPDEVTFISALKACAKIGETAKGERIHDKIISLSMLDRDIVLGNILVDMYAKGGALVKAQQALEGLPFRDVVTWTALMAGYAQQGQGEEALKCFVNMLCEGHSPSTITFTCALKACGIIGTCSKGRAIHEKIESLVTMERDAVLGSVLVDMYVKCGFLAKSQQVFEELPVRDAVTWSAVMVKYVQHGQGEEALKCYDNMLCEGHFPDLVTLIYALKVCGSLGAAAKGNEIHLKVASLGLLEKNVVLANHLVDMYAKCGAFVKAFSVLEQLPIRNVVTWSALIAGYVQHGQGAEALHCYDSMLCEGHYTDAVTFACALKACGIIGSVVKGTEIHNTIVRLGMLEKDIMLGNSLVDMYARCDVLAKMQQVLEYLPVRDVVTWTIVIAGYAQHGKGEEALKCYNSMLCEGHIPNAITFICALKACGTIKAAAIGEEIYYKVLSLGMLEKDFVVGTAVVDMYAKCGFLARAQQVLDQLPVQDAVIWSSIITGYAQQGQGEEALNCFDSMLYEGLSPDAALFANALKVCGRMGAAAKGEQIHDKIVSLCMLEKDIVVGNILVDIYAKFGALIKAQQVLEELPVRDVLTWSALIAGYAKLDQGEDVLKCFNNMVHEGHSPNSVTFIRVLKACGSVGIAEKGREIHDKIVNMGMLDKDIASGTGLVDMYAKCGALTKAQQVLEELPVRDVVAWSALIAGYAKQGQGVEALKCFHSMLCEGHVPDAVTFSCALKACGIIGALAKGEEIHERVASLGMLETNIVLGGALVDMYAKCGAFAKAQHLLEKLPVRDAVMWNSLITGYTQQGQGEEALRCFDSMLRDGHSPDAVTFACALKACGSIGAATKGEQIHDKIVFFGMLEKDFVLGNILVDMYAKCGAPKKALEVFEELPIKDVVTWNALIGGYAQQGQSLEAIDCFKRMQLMGVKPNLITFTLMLNVCSHSGLSGQAERCFSGMSIIYGINPDMDHYCCMVDLCGRTGKFNKALSLIGEMLSDEYLPLWISLLGASRKWGEVKIGTLAFKRACNLDKNNDAVFVLMASIYTTAGMLEDADKIEILRLTNKV